MKIMKALQLLHFGEMFLNYRDLTKIFKMSTQDESSTLLTKFL